MKKKHKIKSLIFIGIALLIFSLCVWQRENLKALYIYLTNDKEALSMQIEENKNDLEQNLQKYSPSITRDFTLEEEEKIKSGELSVDDAMAEITKKSEGSGTKKGNSANLNKYKGKEDEIIGRYVAKLYSLKAFYIGQLGQVESKAKSEYASLSAAEKKNLTKASFIAKYAGYALKLMGECDSQVNGILSELETELSRVGGDLSVINVIRKSYENEKALRKAYYIDMLS
ncbi:MAG: hypothetical protein Q8882_04660 [Bacillota bacterium]|nr:hypothetical protein [Bacillota bacterium]